MRTHSARIDDCSASNQQYPFGRRPRTGRLDRELVPTCAFELYILRSAAPGPTECISAATASAIWSNIDRLGPVQNPAYRTSCAEQLLEWSTNVLHSVTHRLVCTIRATALC